MIITKASTKYQVVIPKIIRTKIKIAPAQRFSVEIENGKITLNPLPSSWEEIAGSATETFRKLGGGKAYFLKERAKWN